MKKGSKFSKGKKKIIIALLSVAVLGAAVALIVHETTKITNDSYLNCAIGDINGDGYINALDSLLLIESTADDSEKLFDSQKRLADVNLDGKVNSTDALILQRYIVGDIKSIPYNENDLSNKKGQGKTAEYENDFSFTSVQILNEWDNGDGTHSYQLNLVLKNTGKKEIEETKSVIAFNAPIKLSKFWDCKCDAGANDVTIQIGNVPVESAATCGIIVTAQEGLLINGVAVNDK